MKIIYPNNDGGITVITPFASVLDLRTIASKDVPAGVPYLIVDDSELPDSYEFRPAWEADFSEPDGYGVGHDAWFEMEAALAPKPTPAPAPGDTAIQAELTANAETQGSNYKW